MKSQMIEFLRFGKGEGALVEDNPYLVTVGSSDSRQFLMPINHKDCLDLLSHLHYLVGNTAASDALKRLSDVVTKILQPPTPGAERLQLDLVTNAAEIWTLPFEAAMDANGQPLFAGPHSKMVLTRRIRQKEFAERARPLPHRPRILLVTAAPGGRRVPLDEHQKALEQSLAAWIEPLQLDGYPEVAPDAKSVLHVLTNASIETIRSACTEARKKKEPFTHIHVLAHGDKIHDENHGYRDHYGLLLEPNNGKPTEAHDLVSALGIGDGLPLAVTLCVCDGGNAQNSIAPGNLALKLHQEGIPIVVASQLPMTSGGSVILTKEFYTALLKGDDVRTALFQARTALYNDQAKAGNDWVGMVSYVQLTEGYADRLLEVRLRSAMASLKTAQRWADDLSKKKITRPDDIDLVRKKLEARIVELKSFLRDCEKQPELYLENLGLLGSASKRLAELLFRHSQDYRKPMQSAHCWYLQANQKNLSHHWTGVQHLALEAALTGKIAQPEYWHSAHLAAKLTTTKNSPGDEEQRGWAWGSLAELYLLAPLACSKPMPSDAAEAIRELKQISVATENPYLIESTLSQLRRYCEWWTNSNSYFPGRTDLALDAGHLMELLK